MGRTTRAAAPQTTPSARRVGRTIHQRRVWLGQHPESASRTRTQYCCRSRRARLEHQALLRGLAAHPSVRPEATANAGQIDLPADRLVLGPEATKAAFLPVAPSPRTGGRTVCQQQMRLDQHSNQGSAQYRCQSGQRRLNHSEPLGSPAGCPAAGREAKAKSGRVPRRRATKVAAPAVDPSGRLAASSSKDRPLRRFSQASPRMRRTADQNHLTGSRCRACECQSESVGGSK